MKISEQTSQWTKEARSIARSCLLLAQVENQANRPEVSEVLQSIAVAANALADDIHARFVAPSIGKPPVTRKRKSNG